MIESAGGMMGLIGKLLEFFQQKAYVYVNVAFGDVKPYRLTVCNNSKFDIHLNEMKAEPNGFGVKNNGWDILKGGLFRNKVMKPGQSIVFVFSSEDMGTDGVKTFIINYGTIIKGKVIPRYEQSCNFHFDRDSYSVQVSSSLTIPYESSNTD